MVLATGLTSCSEESLTLSSPNEVTVESLLATADGTEQLLIGAYDGYQKIPQNEFLIAEVRSDNARFGSANESTVAAFNTFTLTDNNGEVFNYWSNNYKVIFQANLVIGNQSNYLGFAGSRNNVIGEAYFLRALSHFNLVRAFRDIPYVDRTVTLEDYQSILQGTESDTYDKIVSDFENAITFLEGADSSQIRATEGTAIIFLAKALLSQPSPDYVRAQSLLLPLISDGNEFGYTLTDNFDDIFARGDAGSESNEEIIFQIPFSLSSGGVTSDSEADNQIEQDSETFSFNMSAGGSSGGANVGTDNLKALMTTALEPVRSSTSLDQINFTLDDTFTNKFVPDNFENSSNDWIVLRYADVLLLYAEAVIGDTAGTINQDAIDAYNKVRERAGVSLLTTGATLTRELLLSERRLEFVFENQRFYDLIRFGTAVEVLQTYSDAEGYFFNASNLYLVTPQREIDNTDGFFN